MRYLANRVATGELRGDPVDAHRDPAEGRRPLAERVEQEAEARVGLLLADPMISNTRRWTSVRLMRIDPPPISVPSSTSELNTSRECRG
jgi:hypothetical protein